MKKPVFVSVILLISCVLSTTALSQEVVKDTTTAAGKQDSTQKAGRTTSLPEWKPSTSLYFELLGIGWYSVNVDFRKRVTSAWSIGFQFSEGFWPDVMYYRLYGDRRRLEVGGGVSAAFSFDKILAACIHASIGYRVQVKDGLIFRIGFRPFYIKSIQSVNDINKVMPWAGLSLGYSF